MDELQQQPNNTFHVACTDLCLTVFSRLAGPVLEKRWGCFKGFLSKALFWELIFFPFYFKGKRKLLLCSVFTSSCSKGIEVQHFKGLVFEILFFPLFFFKDKKSVPYGLLRKFSKILRGQLLGGLPEAWTTHFPAPGLWLCRQNGALAGTSAGRGRLQPPYLLSTPGLCFTAAQLLSFQLCSGPAQPPTISAFMSMSMSMSMSISMSATGLL